MFNSNRSRNRSRRACPILVLAVLALGVALLVGACTGPAGPQGPPGPEGPQGPAPSEAEIQAIVADQVTQALTEPSASADSIARGGRLYDKWWTEAGVDQPAGDQALWALQTANTRSGGATWRCKECHGWDYKGKGGAYGSGSHYTGFPGTYDAFLTKSKAQLLDVLMGGTDYRHDFSSMLSEANLEDLANFLKEGPINTTLYIEYATKTPIGADLANGQALYQSTCAMCHGDDGKQIEFHGGEYLGTVATDNPWEALHKVRFGQPGTPMPSAIVNGWSLQDALDVVGYAQTLPTE